MTVSRIIGKLWWFCVTINVDLIESTREGNDADEQRQVTYRELRAEVNRFANVLKGQGIVAGDRVAIYLPVTIELVVAMLACARIGAVHTVVVSLWQSLVVMA